MSGADAQIAFQAPAGWLSPGKRRSVIKGRAAKALLGVVYRVELHRAAYGGVGIFKSILLIL